MAQSVMVGAALAFAAVAQLGCHRQCDLERPVPVQVLASASEVLNPDIEGKPWALNLWLVELKSDQSLEGIDGKAVIDSEKRDGEESPFGEERVQSRPQTIFHSEDKLWEIELSPETKHVVTVANFRQRVGDAWMNVYELPPNYPQQRCEAERKRKRSRKIQPESAPCIYLAFDSNEVRGGAYRPAGLDTEDFGDQKMVCAPVVDIDEKKRKKQKRREERKKKRRSRLQAPSLKQTAPTTPKPTMPKPTTPKPTVPVKPALPVPR